MLIVSFFVLAACANEPSLPIDDLLAKLGVTGPQDFAELSACRQIEILAEVGSQHLDIHHALLDIPDWMEETISMQPSSEIANCIAQEGENILSLIDEEILQRETISYKIHALVYEARDLNIIDYPSVRTFVVNAMCTQKLWYRGSLAPIFYAATQPDLLTFPDPNEIFETFCQ